MRRAIAVLAVLALAGCGGDEAPSGVVPADATTYVGMDASEAERLVSGTSRDVDFERDVKPWLGDRVAYFVVGRDDAAGFVFESEDDEAAEAFGRKVASGGPQRASAVIDGRLVLTSSRELLRAANAAADVGSLADSTRLDVTGEDGDDPPDLLLATDDPDAFFAGLDAYDVLPDELPAPVEAFAAGPLTARVWDERVELSGLAPVADVAPSLADIPGAASFAFASADLGEDLAVLANRDGYERAERLSGIDLARSVRPHLGAGSFFVQGGGARLRAETSDEAALRREAVALARRLGPKGVDLDAGPDSLRLEVDRKGIPPVVLEIEGGRVLLDVGETPGGVAEDLGDTRRYRDAERRLGGPPTLLSARLAARRAGRTLTVVEVRATS